MKKAKRIVLGEGEIIGHKHILESKKEMQYQEKIYIFTVLIKLVFLKERLI
jgi:hypothetical protein